MPRLKKEDELIKWLESMKSFTVKVIMENSTFNKTVTVLCGSEDFVEFLVKRKYKTVKLIEIVGETETIIV